MKSRVLVADDHTLVSEGICKLLEVDYELVGAVNDGRAMLRAAEHLRPDVVLCDISMPVLNGIDACRELVKILPKSRVIFVTMHAGVEYVEEAFLAGGVGYLLKRSATAELAMAINRVARGGKYITPLVDWKEPPARTNQNDSPKAPSEKLTARQREVLQLVAEGRSNKEIASLLYISEKTVDFHKSTIKRALKLRSTAELTQFAVRHRLIDA